MSDVKNTSSKIRPCAAADAAIVTAMVCCVFATSNTFLSDRPDRVVVFRQNSVIAEYALEDDIAFTVKGKRGSLGVEIKDRSAAILHAECPRQTCKQFGAIRQAHEQLICAPNNILIEIQSSKAKDADEDDIDGVTY